jgi:hypothetical protein
MAKSCHGFKAASQQNRFRARFFLRHHRSAAGSGGGFACISSFVSLSVACGLSPATTAPLLFYFADGAAVQARGHA